jgi:hypothetical protein
MPSHGSEPQYGQNSPPGEILESWKEIAAFLGRDVRTARRWEKTLDLPVHRFQRGKLDSIFAYRKELEAWRASRTVDHPRKPDSTPTRPNLAAALPEPSGPKLLNRMWVVLNRTFFR